MNRPLVNNVNQNNNPTSCSSQNQHWFNVCSVIVVGVLFYFSHSAQAQNPSYGGKELRHVWTDGDVPAGVDQGVKVTEAYLTHAGIYIINEFTPQGVYFLDNNGTQTVASREQDSFGSTMRWLPLGIVNQEDLLFVPVSINNVYPVYRHGAAGLTAVTEPTPSQSIGQWVDGKMVFTTISGSAGVKVWLYQEGQPDQLLYDEASLPGLNPTLDYDGESVFMSTGKVDVDASVYLRRADGTLKPIIKHGDPLPGSEGTYRGLPTRQGAFVDQGRLYMVAESKETFPFFTDRVLLSSDGDSTEVLLRRGQDVPGLAGAKLDGFEVAQVRNGRVWFVASLSSGGKALYFLENNTWNEVVSTKDSFNGRTPIGLRAFRFGALDDDLLLQVSFLGNNFRPINELYTTADLPGFVSTAPPAPSLGPSLKIDLSSGDAVRITAAARAGETYTLEVSQNLSDWATVGSPESPTEDTKIEWSLPKTGVQQFFRTTSE